MGSPTRCAWPSPSLGSPLHFEEPDKTVVVLHSRRQAITLASFADIDLSLPTNQDGAPVSLGAGDYRLVHVDSEGNLSDLPTAAVSSVRVIPRQTC